CHVQADGSESYGCRQQRTGAAWDDQVLCTLYRDSELPGLILEFYTQYDTVCRRTARGGFHKNRGAILAHNKKIPP
ncbi:hypothetical protein, partial [Gemmiger formicilis]|uniref:hypothetical protein n=1 Tax=Gemmiger formicilis TaxID=745368 RepID=UPI00195BF654